MLAAIDFAVIPQGSVDLKTLAIKDYRNTSGPYYVDKDDAGGNIVLKINPLHYSYTKNIPQQILLIPALGKDQSASLNDFETGKVDFITTIDKASTEDIIKYAKTHSEVNLHTTMNIRNFILCFTPKGLKRLSVEKRFAIGKIIREVFQKNFVGTGAYEIAEQFIPPFGEGGLTEEQALNLRDIFKNAKPFGTAKQLKLTLVRIGDKEKYEKLLKAALPDLEVEIGANIPAFMKFDREDDMPDMFINGPDTGFLENIGLISYSVSAGYFGMTRDEGRQWLNEYILIDEKKERLRKLQALHYKVLTEPVMIPLMVSPYVAIARKPWKINLSQLYANNQLWQIIKE
jgi:hypothetical protein